MIITLEGAPATGKSTIAKHLAQCHGFFRVPEVNELFPDRPKSEPEYWYCERQIDRLNLATTHINSVLDGDAFQAVWFSWLYPDRGFADWSRSMEFFRANVHAITLPSFYAHLHASDSERYEREKGREEARGRSHDQFVRKWSRYVDFQAPHKALFDAMSRQYPGWVVSLKAADVEVLAEKLLSTTSGDPPDAIEFVEWLGDWLGSNNSEDFR
jgi:adenylate kinase family enzyme